MLTLVRPIGRAWDDLKTLSHLVRPASRSGVHADRLEHFYRGQAVGYDAFRARLLPGRREMVQSLGLKPGAVWVDLGGGTAHNLLHAGPALAQLQQVHVIDITPSLLAIARDRCRTQGWTNVSIMESDATAVDLPDASADFVTCSYSLTMIPDWFAALDEALRLLKPGGIIGVVDFYVSRPAAAPHVQHSTMTRCVWPWWFGHSHVALSPDHLPYLQRRFKPLSLVESRTPLPYVPFGRVPCYRFVGTKP